ncbi:MAG: UDP-N-acetylmuramate:L-alanyl-gamma-D-glutamyl-meso-diaminopimelate ligase [Proteobacteria bacterium]|nr:UDP-N-acetylmuramate:L-alanyl-gamma-D-glutamyl-meso-diaminopimelate ligase [Pseudomonadota bacterium]MBU1711231.1 UDP-N-acetylmuramate:L-alanyl-gamma-D-glutamyl-meso-diaminopimelate ligase [Pseudomonadota bacterium]
MLDPSLNFFPDPVKHIHLMGACGTGMGALAGMLIDSGYRVTGSDANIYPPMSDFLAGIGVALLSGYGPGNLDPEPDLVVVGNVISAGNPEAVSLYDRGLPYVSFPQAMGHYFLKGKSSIVVSGTHGKTTTSSILATALDSAGLDPGFMIGGLVQAFGRNFNIGSGDYFVIEGDEYDTAFFDKGPKFLHYQPQIAIITSIEFDHADIFDDLDSIKKAFRKLVEIVPTHGCIVACMDDPVVREIVAHAKCPVKSYGTGPDQEWSLRNLVVSRSGTRFEVLKNGEPFVEVMTAMPGMHNALNSLAVIAVLDHIGVSPEKIAQGLKEFQGVKRRQEVRGIAKGVTVIDDFAHHPTAVEATLAALKGAYDGDRLIAVFEPRTNSSRRKIFQNAYVDVFGKADMVLIKEPEPLKNIPESARFSSHQLVADLVHRHSANAQYFADTEAILNFLVKVVEPGDVVAILSNGGFDNIHERLLAMLKE